MLEEKFNFKEFVRFVFSEPMYLFILFLLIAGLASSVYGIYYYGKPEVRAEVQLKQCVEKISLGNKYVVLELPVLKETEKLLKEEHYEVYKELKEKQEVVYKKNDKE